MVDCETPKQVIDKLDGLYLKKSTSKQLLIERLGSSNQRFECGFYFSKIIIKEDVLEQSFGHPSIVISLFAIGNTLSNFHVKKVLCEWRSRGAIIVVNLYSNFNTSGNVVKYKKYTDTSTFTMKM